MFDFIYKSGSININWNPDKCLSSVQYCTGSNSKEDDKYIALSVSVYTAVNEMLTSILKDFILKEHPDLSKGGAKLKSFTDNIARSTANATLLKFAIKLIRSANTLENTKNTPPINQEDLDEAITELKNNGGQRAFVDLIKKMYLFHIPSLGYLNDEQKNSFEEAILQEYYYLKSNCAYAEHFLQSGLPDEAFTIGFGSFDNFYRFINSLPENIREQTVEFYNGLGNRMNVAN